VTESPPGRGADRQADQPPHRPAGRSSGQPEAPDADRAPDRDAVRSGNPWGEHDERARSVRSATDRTTDQGAEPATGSVTETDAAPDRAARVPPPSRPRTTAGRAAAVIALFAVLGAVLASVAAGVTWWAEDFTDPLTGPVTITASGSSVVPELVPVALVALAGLGAALATHGVLRRIVGAVLLIGGALLAIRCSLALGAAPDSLVQDLPRPADPVGAARLSVWGPLLGVAGGVLIAAAGGLIVAGRGARRMSARYEAPGSAAATAGADRADARGRATDIGQSTDDWWKALDAGSDPTADPDAGTPSGTDLGTAAGDDSRSNSGTESGTDSRTESGTESGTDSGADSAPDSATGDR